MRDISEIINKACVKYYNPFKDLAVDEVIDLFKGRIVFKQYIKEILASEFSNCVIWLGTLNDMKVYLGKHSTTAPPVRKSVV